VRKTQPNLEKTKREARQGTVGTAARKEKIQGNTTKGRNRQEEKVASGQTEKRRKRERKVGKRSGGDKKRKGNGVLKWGKFVSKTCEKKKCKSKKGKGGNHRGHKGKKRLKEG